MGEQNISDEPIKIGSAKPLASNKEQTRVPLRQRLHSYAQTWWHERGGPEGVTDEYLKSVDAIHAAIPPGTTEEFFRSKIRPILEARAKAAGYAAMVGEVTLSALTTAWFVKRGKRAAQRFQTTVDAAVETTLNRPDLRDSFDSLRETPSAHEDLHGMVIDNVSPPIVFDDRGFSQTAADDVTIRGIWKGVSSVAGAVIRGGNTLAGVAAGAAVIERGSVHAVAKISAKAEGAAGVAVVKIVDRIVKGWSRS